MNFKTLDSMLQGRNRNSRKLANNTYAIRRSDYSVDITLHGNVIMRFAGRTVQLFDGGWRSATTKERLNRFTSRNIQIFQKNWVWYFSNPYETAEFYNGLTFWTD